MSWSLGLNPCDYLFHNYDGFGALDSNSLVTLANEYEPDSLSERVMSDWVLSDDLADKPISDGKFRETAVVDPNDSNEVGKISASRQWSWGQSVVHQGC